MNQDQRHQSRQRIEHFLFNEDVIPIIFGIFNELLNPSNDKRSSYEITRETNQEKNDGTKAKQSIIRHLRAQALRS